MSVIERWEASTAGSDPTRRGRTWGGGGGTPINSRDDLILGDYRPGPLTTGPLPGTTLAQHTGDITYTSATAVDSVEFVGRVTCGAKIDFTNCVFHGRPRATAAGSIASVIGTSGSNLHGSTFTDCRFDSRGGYAHPLKDDLAGGNFTIRRCEIVGACDSISLTAQGLGATIEQNWSHGCSWESWPPGTPDRPSHPDFQTHNDGVQFHRGGPYYVRGNYFGGFRVPNTPNDPANDDWHNACLMIQQEVSSNSIDHLGIVVAEYNWFEGGTFSVNIQLKYGNTMSETTVRHNRYIRPTWTPASYPITWNSGVHPTLSDNVWDDTGGAVPHGTLP